MATQSQQQNYGTGRRKSAVARVYLRPGKGTITVNDRPVDEFFSRDRAHDRAPAARADQHAHEL